MIDTCSDDENLQRSVVTAFRRHFVFPFLSSRVAKDDWNRGRIGMPGREIWSRTEALKGAERRLPIRQISS